MKKVRAVVDGSVTLDPLHEKSTERIRQAYSFPNPAYQAAVRMGYASDMAESIELCLEYPDGRLRLPRGDSKRLTELLAKDGLEPKWIDKRAKGSTIEIGKSGFDLRYYQTEAIDQIAKRIQGVVVIPCGGGKTAMSVGMIARLKLTTLVLVHTNDLLEQWIGVVKERLGIDPGVICGSKKVTVREITIASVMKLDRLITPEDNSLVQGFGAMIMDEAHHVPAATFARVMGAIPARVRVGLTATPEREDGLTRVVYWNCGPELYRKSVQELIEEKFLDAPEIQFVSTGLTFEYNGRKDRRTEALAQRVLTNKARNALIVDIVERDYLAGEPVLLLSNRKTHCRKLAKLLADRGVIAHVLTSDSRKATRTATIEAMRDADSRGLVQVVIATSLADEGLDIERLSRIVLAWPEKGKGRTMQRLGRLMRPFEGKNSKLYDIIDPLVSTLVYRAKERRRVYKQVGLIDGGKPSGWDAV